MQHHTSWQGHCSVIAIGSQPRNRSLISQLSMLGIVPNWVGAIDFRCLDPKSLDHWVDQLSIAQQARAPLTPGELGCLLSHRLAWHRFLDSGATWGLVLEEDAEILPGLRDICVSVETAKWRSASIISLEHRRSSSEMFPLMRYRKRPVDGERDIYRSLSPTWGAAGYLLNRPAAERLLRGGIPAVAPADWPYEAAGCRFYVAWPPAISTPDEGRLLPKPPGDLGPHNAALDARESASALWALRRRLTQFRRLPRDNRSLVSFVRWNHGAWPLTRRLIPKLLLEDAQGDGGCEATFLRCPERLTSGRATLKHFFSVMRK